MEPRMKSIAGIPILAAAIAAAVSADPPRPGPDGDGTPAPAAEVRSQSRSIAVAVSEKGEVTAVTWTERNASRPVRLRTVLDGLSEMGEARARTEGAVYLVERRFAAKDGSSCIVAERFLPAGDSVRWNIEVRGEGGPWSAPITTEIVWPEASRARFWTAWGDPRPVPAAPDWSDPLEPVPFRDGTLHYGGLSFTRSDTFGIPFVAILEEAAGIGLSAAVSPEDVLRDMRLDVSAGGSLRLVRTGHRLAAGRPVRTSIDLVAHGADWRPGLAWMAYRYMRFFDPKIQRADRVAGCGAYSIHEGDIDAWKLHRMAFRTNWKASYDFPHMGMFLPPVGDGEEWINFRRAPTSIRRLAGYSERMRALGFHVLNYFNITEYGATYKYPPPARKAASDADLWKDPNDSLFHRFGDAILPGPDGKPIGSWEGCVAMDPGERVYQDFLVDQARLHVAKLPASSGICIDRMDWAAFYNRKRDDGVSWIDGGPARSLLGSWRQALGRIGPVFHSAGKVVFANPHVKRLDLMEQVDGIYEEFTQIPFNLNLVGLLAVRKPALGWVGSAGDLRPDPDTFLQRFLYMGVFPTAPYPANDHTINPDPKAERFYLDYGPLLDRLRGRTWVLEERPIEVEGRAARANLFDVPGGYIAPVVLGGKAASAKLRIRLPGGVGPDSFRIDALRPGIEAPAAVTAAFEGGRIALDVPLERGCALVRLARVWAEPAPGPIIAGVDVSLRSAASGAELRYQVLDGDGFAGEWPKEWKAFAGPIRIERTATVRAAPFRDGAQVGTPLLATYYRLPLPQPEIEPAGKVFEGEIPVTLRSPGNVPGAEVRYTIDGSRPTASSALYEGPIVLRESATVRARTFREGAEPGADAEARFAKLPPAPPAPAVFLDELKPAVATAGWGGAPRAGRSIQDKPLSVAGKVRSKGIGSHARSEIAYDLEPRFGRFVAVAGIDDEMKDYAQMASADFRVLIDGKEVAASPVLRAGERWHFDVPIPAGAKRIALVAGDGGDGINADHADWVEAGFTER
jgi:hypothetical protein